MVIDILEKSKSYKTLVGLNFYGSSTGFYCGYVLDFNDDFVIIQHFTKFGFYDGLLVHKLSDIKYYETDTQYLRGIELAIENRKLIEKQTYNLKKENDSTEKFSSLIESFIGNKEYLIKFEMNDDEIYFGFIEWCDESYFSILNIDGDGLTIGKATFKFEDLTLYWIDDLECRKRKLLYTSVNLADGGL